MASSAKELDLNPDVYIGLTYPIKSGKNLDFELTKTSFEQAEYNLTNLLLTQKGERAFQPEFGTTLRSICFEQVDDNLPETIETDIRNQKEIKDMICENCKMKVIKDWDIDTNDNVIPVDRCGCNV